MNYTNNHQNIKEEIGLSSHLPSSYNTIIISKFDNIDNEYTQQQQQQYNLNLSQLQQQQQKQGKKHGENDVVKEYNDPKKILEGWIKNLVEDKIILLEKIKQIRDAYYLKWSNYLNNLKIQYNLDENDELLNNFKNENEAFIKNKLETIEFQIKQGFFIKDKLLECLNNIQESLQKNAEILFKTLSTCLKSMREQNMVNHSMLTRTAKKLNQFNKSALRPTPTSQQQQQQNPDYIKNSHIKPKKKIPEQALKVLKAWLMENVSDPYPSKEVKLDLANKTGLHINQVHNWFINARGRICKKYSQCEKFSKLVEKQYLGLLQNSKKMMPKIVKRPYQYTKELSDNYIMHV